MGTLVSIGMGDAGLTHCHRPGDITEHQMKLGEIGGANRRVSPALLPDTALKPSRIGATASLSRPSALRRKAASLRINA
jgi:hypothetical protein